MKEIPTPSPKPEEINTKKSEHLKEGVSPIIACVGTPEHFGWGSFETPEHYGLSNSRRNRNTNYYGTPTKLQEENFKNPEEYSYVISPVDELDKVSSHFYNCTGILVAGRDKRTGQNISLLSHQDPDYFLDNREQFVVDLKERLEEIRNRSEEQTVDAVILGGNYIEKYPTNSDSYLKSIKLLTKEIVDTLGFEPVIIVGPKQIGGHDNVYYDNEK